MDTGQAKGLKDGQATRFQPARKWIGNHPLLSEPTARPGGKFRVGAFPAPAIQNPFPLGKVSSPLRTWYPESGGASPRQTAAYKGPVPLRSASSLRLKDTPG